jgi:hypothetical protein
MLFFDPLILGLTPQAFLTWLILRKWFAGGVDDPAGPWA